MTERIKELALQCGAWHQVYNNKRFMVDSNFNIEKFAKLIVRECLTIVENECDDTLYDDGFHMGEFCGTLMYTIEEHFGVQT